MLRNSARQPYMLRASSERQAAEWVRVLRQAAHARPQPSGDSALGHAAVRGRRLP